MKKQTDFNPFSILLLLGILTAFGPFSTDTYLSSLPLIAESFGSDLSAAQFSLSTFFLGLAVGQAIYGPLTDRFGRKRPLLLGIGVYTLASALLLIAPSMAAFNALRFLQALGAAAGVIISRAIISDLFKDRDAAKALSTMMTIQGIGPVLAPSLGALIVAAASWHAIFLFLTIFGLFCFFATLRVLPETLPVPQRQDVRLRQLLKIWGALLFRARFVVPMLASALALASVFAFISGSPFVFMKLHGIGQHAYAWLFATNAIGMTLANQINRALLKRFLPRQILPFAIGGHVLCALALVLLHASPSLVVFVVPLYLCLATIPLIGANGVALAMTASGVYAGSASSLIGVTQFLFACLASALVGIWDNGTALPMTGLILASGLSSGAVLTIGHRFLRKTVKEIPPEPNVF